jgi:hypothetical protein
MRWIFILLLPLLLFFLFLPKIASTSLGKPYFVKALEKKTESQIEIDSLHLSWFGPQQFKNIKWKHEAVHGTVEQLDILAPFWSFSGPFQLKNGTVQYPGGIVKSIEGRIEENDFTLTGKTLQGHLSLNGKVYNKLDFHLFIDIERFPLVVLDQKLDQILGPTLDLKGSVKFKEGEGALDVVANASHFQMHLKGLFKENNLTLEEPLIASFQLTPELSALLLKEANPLFLTGLSAEKPLTLRIEPKGFSFPLPFSLEKLKVGEATLNPGRIQCQNGQSLSTLISLFNNSSLSHPSEMNIWFGLATFHIEKGILKADRVDALIADSIHVCTFGTIDLIHDRLDMILGLPADTLRAMFGIQNLPPDYVLKIQVRGTTKEPELVKGPAIAKIAALIAANQLPSQGILGELGSLFSRPKVDPDIPPPKRPFPWEN